MKKDAALTLCIATQGSDDASSLPKPGIEHYTSHLNLAALEDPLGQVGEILEMVNGKHILLVNGYPYYKKNLMRSGLTRFCCRKAACNVYLHVDDGLCVVHSGAMIYESCGESSKGSLPITFIIRGGGTVLLYAGHQYILKERYKNGIAAWECTNRRKQKCGGKMKLKDNQVVGEKKHDCLPDFGKNEIDAKLFQCKKELTSHEFSTVNAIYSAALESHNAELEISKRFPPFKSVKSSFYRARKAAMGFEKDVCRDAAEVKVPEIFETRLV